MEETNTASSANSRRDFLKISSLAATSFFIVPRHVLGKGFVAPSDKLNIAGIGAGGKGKSDLASFSASPNVNIVALCDVDDRQSVESRKRFPKATYYKDFREMLSKEHKHIDACSISTPDNTHAVATLAAMQLGKHVYTQKPLTHDIYEARILGQAAKKYKVITQMGNQGGSGNGVRRMKEIYDSGIIGEVHKVLCWTNRPVWPQAIPTDKTYEIPKELDFDLWLGPAKKVPYNEAYLPWNWRGWWPYGTGALGDMACHIMDPVFRILPIDYPTSVECSVAGTWTFTLRPQDDNPDWTPFSTSIHLDYPRKDSKGNIKVSWYDGGILPELPEELLPGESFGNSDGGVLFIGSKGKLMADCYGANPRLLPLKDNQLLTIPETIPRVPNEDHYLQWVDACIAGYGKGVTSSPFEYAAPFTESILIGNLALRSWMLRDNPSAKRSSERYNGRKKLYYDAPNMKITNYDLANQFVKRDYRDGWSLTL
ncbi:MULTISPECIES: Gfo/Idh/MocA family oxidoreductase [unclassified Spirosoma]|uniref:Gfo/Idh/MocA family protein n=1 Tax=unclassified Spirosoma TaxID=2621999 RepID=UPI00095D0DE8|nr:MULTISPECIES: Gfo/Idh/MocA family oxidoreductase [unclassified Spirosoma]MBN8827020.1 Gfo/Idh/MocA family oxidoreductase [Spirosoma sp.]OJW74433.1 MAG: oxidoreductase [Spirosoma sp. 48-14]